MDTAQWRIMARLPEQLFLPKIIDFARRELTRECDYERELQANLRMKEYFKKLGTAVPENDDTISIAILQDCNTIMLYDSHNFSIGFK